MKYTTKSFALSAIVASSFSTASAADIAYNGWLEMFGKAGANNQAIDEVKGVYPTDSFANIVGSFGVAGNLLSEEVENQALSYGFNFSAGSMVYDSTSKDFPLAPGSVNNEYMGFYAGYSGLERVRERLYVINNAYLHYTYKGDEDSRVGVDIKAGRYLSGAEYMSGYTQGVELATNVRLSDEQSLKLWWFSSYGRAFAFGQWLLDFYAPNGYETPSGRFANYGTHAFKAVYSISGLDITPYVYFSPGTYTAPAFRIEYDTDKGFSGEGFRARTFANILLPIYDDRFFINGVGAYRWGSRMDKYTQSLLIQQQFDYDAYNFGLGVYKNFGHANARVGSTGNPWMMDFWTATSYDIGRAVTDMVGKDAITPYLFVGGTHLDSRFWWQVLGRWTDSQRSREHSLALNVMYKIDEKLSVGGKIEYFEDTTKANYKVGVSGDASGTPQNIADRSHAFLWIHYDI